MFMGLFQVPLSQQPLIVRLSLAPPKYLRSLGPHGQGLPDSPSAVSTTLAPPSLRSRGQHGVTGRTRELRSQAHVHRASPSPFSVLAFLLCAFLYMHRSGENHYIDPQDARHSTSVWIHVVQSHLIHTPTVLRRGLKYLKADRRHPIVPVPNTLVAVPKGQEYIFSLRNHCAIITPN